MTKPERFRHPSELGPPTQPSQSESGPAAQDNEVNSVPPQVDTEAYKPKVSNTHPAPPKPKR